MMFTNSRIGNTGMEFKDVDVSISRNVSLDSCYVEITLEAGVYPCIHKHEITIRLAESEADIVLDKLIEGLIIQRELSRHSEVGADG